jgi:hypothetical protein
MANFYIKKTTGNVIALDDLGIEIQGGVNSIYDLSSENASDIAISVDLATSVASGEIQIVDPRDSNPILENRLVLSIAQGLIALDNANTAHYGVVGGRLASVDDPTQTPTADTYLKFDNLSDTYVSVPASDVISDGGSVDAIQNILANTITDSNDIDITVIPPSGTGTGDGSIAIGVTDGSFLRGDGDDNILTGNTITVDDGGAISVASGGTLTVEDEPSNPNDVANKAYVDAARAGLDAKESCLVATTINLSGYNPTGGSANTGELSGQDDTVDGINLQIGDRILVKNQTDAKQNGIYTVQDVGTAANGVWVRADDQNGDPVEDVSAGNFTLIEQGTFTNTGWVVQGQGVLTLNTDDIVWVKINAANDYLAGEGLSLDVLTFNLDIESLTTAAADFADEIAFFDIDADSHKKSSFTQLFSDLNVPSNITNTGFIAKDSSGDFVSRSIEESITTNLEGISVVNGDGVSGNPQIGLNINGLTSGTSIDLNNDAIVIYNASGDQNFKYSIQDVLDLGATTNSFSTWSIAGNQVGDASIIADSSTETITLTGGNGIALNSDNTAKSLDISITKAGLPDVAVELPDSVLLFDSSNNNQASSVSFENLFDDLSVVRIASANTGIVTKVADNGGTSDYALREIESSTVDSLGGISVVDGDLVNGNASIGLDINGLVDSATVMDAADEFAVYDQSATQNVSMSGQQVADGVANILGFNELELSSIDGQNFLTIVDQDRDDKKLSVDSTEFVFSENRLNPNNWINIGSSVNAFNGYVVPFDATIVYATSSCDEATGDYDLEIYVNNDSSGTAISYLNGDNNKVLVNNELNIDVDKGQRIRVRAVSTSGSGRLEDTVISVFVKWRVAGAPV